MSSKMRLVEMAQSQEHRHDASDLTLVLRILICRCDPENHADRRAHASLVEALVLVLAQACYSHFGMR